MPTIGGDEGGAGWVRNQRKRFFPRTPQSDAATRVRQSAGMNDLTNLDVNNRKMRKPLMERKRRARINRSLDELHALLTETSFTAKGTKLEKADILEMTVQYLKQSVKHARETEQNLENALLERYLSGFERCAEEIENLLEPQLGRALHRHLQDCLERVKTEQRADGEWKRCSVLVPQPEDLKILPSKLPNGDVLLFLSASLRCGERLDKRTVWRPWW